jgi:restriction system protein
MNRWNTDFQKETLFYKIQLGRKHIHFKECYENKYVGLNYNAKFDLSNNLNDTWDDFREKFRPQLQEINLEMTKIAAGLTTSALHIISNALKIGDYVLCPDGSGNYAVGQITSEYKYLPDNPVMHCREVEWISNTIARSEMSKELQNSSGSVQTLTDLTIYSTEIKQLIGTSPTPVLPDKDDIEDVSMFHLEAHLEDFLIQNWEYTELSKEYDIFVDEEVTGQQFQTDTGRIDILAISKDKKTLLVIELKRGRANDKVVGQLQRYMGFIKDEFLENGQSVKGLIIALEDDLGLRRALSVTSDIEFLRYNVKFELLTTHIN